VHPGQFETEQQATPLRQSVMNSGSMVSQVCEMHLWPTFQPEMRGGASGNDHLAK